MANDGNLSIRCTNHTKEMFNAIAKKNAHLSKGELLEEMINRYQAVETINNDAINEVLKLTQLNHEYIAFMMKCNKSIPTNVATVIKLINEEASRNARVYEGCLSFGLYSS